MYKKIKLSVILRGGYVYSVGYVYCFLPNVPGAMFIQGGTFIPESRVKANCYYQYDKHSCINLFHKIPQFCLMLSNYKETD
jgi:hypothetical protein